MNMPSLPIRVFGTLIFLALFLVALSICAYIFLPEWMTSQFTFQDSKDYFAFLVGTRASFASVISACITALSALAAMAALYATYLGYVAGQDKSASDVIAKGAELLGSEDFNKRLGAVHSLSRLARASTRDYIIVSDILSAFLRTNYGAVDPPKDENTTTRSTDAILIQAIIAMLGESTLRRFASKLRYNFSHVKFEGISLNQLDLSRTIFVNSRLTGVDFSNSNLDGADFTNAEIRGCIFTGAKTKATILDGAFIADQVGLTQRQISVATGTETTGLPEGFRHPDSWLARVNHEQ